jgi:predicted nucleic acid-binding protein
VSRIFFDTNLFIDLLEDAGALGARVTEILERMSDRRDELLTSALVPGIQFITSLERAMV